MSEDINDRSILDLQRALATERMRNRELENEKRELEIEVDHLKGRVISEIGKKISYRFRRLMERLRDTE